MSDGRAQFILAVTLASPHPERLASFYQNVLGLPLKPFERGNIKQEWACDIGDVHFAIERAEAQGGNAMMSFAVADAEAFVERLAAHGLKAERGPEPVGENSIGVWFRDPEGNLVQVVQVDYEWIRYLEDRRERGLDAIERWKASVFH
ncbi:MAG: VOC family protein [Candidatus Xenobia bacterium]